ncbi:MAG TPA: ABC transporter ATP-binding protein [Acidimicrobiales bacterium]
MPPPDTAAEPGRARIKVAARSTGLRKVYGSGPQETVALDDVTVAFQSGRFTAVMGPSGSGKSTLLHCIAGLDTVTTGQVVVGGVELTALSDHELTHFRRERLGFVFQAFNLIPHLTARQNLVLPLTLAGLQVDERWFASVVKTLGLADRLDHKPRELSGGQQQRVAVGRALMTRPNLIFADEPTGNLDSRAGHDVLRLLRHAVDALHQTIVMVTHDPHAAAFTDRVVFLADGRIAGELQGPTVDAVLDRLVELEATSAAAGPTDDGDDDEAGPPARRTRRVRAR